MCRRRGKEANYFIGFGLLLNSFCILCRDHIPHFIAIMLYIVAIGLMLTGIVKERKRRDCL
ncbi:MAG: hypothetical protein ACLROI_00725 [Beduini sp.]|uniref:hypothetical protein n=1 Tax=Beduini sp. TaxID=1922300 RepID=UPI0011CB6E47